MSNPATDRIHAGIEELKTLKDEIRVNLHLAGMDLRDEWKSLERRLPGASTITADLKEITAEVVESFTAELRTFRERLRARGADDGRV